MRFELTACCLRNSTTNLAQPCTETLALMIPDMAHAQVSGDRQESGSALQYNCSTRRSPDQRDTDMAHTPTSDTTRHTPLAVTARGRLADLTSATAREQRVGCYVLAVSEYTGKPRVLLWHGCMAVTRLLWCDVWRAVYSLARRGFLEVEGTKKVGDDEGDRDYLQRSSISQSA